jgi:hypothetical protein
MSTRVHDGFEPPLAKKWTIGLAENEIAGAAIGFLVLVAFIVSFVGMSSLFVLGAFYLRSHVADQPFLGQYFGD